MVIWASKPGQYCWDNGLPPVFYQAIIRTNLDILLRPWQRNIFQWNFVWNSNAFIQEKALRNVISKMVAILSRCVKWMIHITIWSILSYHGHERPSQITLITIDITWKIYFLVEWLEKFPWKALIQLKFADTDGLMQERRNSIASALELRLSCTNPSIENLSHQPCQKWRNAKHLRLVTPPAKYHYIHWTLESTGTYFMNQYYNNNKGPITQMILWH